MRRSTKWLLAGASVGTAAALIAAYGLVFRPWHRCWGATDGTKPAGEPVPQDRATPDETVLLPVKEPARAPASDRIVAVPEPEPEHQLVEA